jgi:cystathionine beta-synthase
MQPAFPIVPANSSIEEVSEKITKTNPAVLVEDGKGSMHIITKYDLIDALH